MQKKNWDVENKTKKKRKCVEREKMGCNTSIQNLVETSAFPSPQCSYSKDHSKLFFVGDVACMSHVVESSKSVVLYAHCNGLDIGRVDDFLQELSQDLQISIVAFDYPSYGLTKGVATEQSCMDSIWKVYDFLVVTGFQPENIILYGSSIGTGPCVRLAATLSRMNVVLGGCLLQTPFTSVVGVASSILERFIVNANIFCSLDYIHFIDCKVLILHGTADTLVPYQHSQKLKRRMIRAGKDCNLITLKHATHSSIESNHYREIVSSLLQLMKK